MLIPHNNKRPNGQDALMAKWKGVSYDEWVETGQYPDGTPLDPNDKNMEDYYENYKEVVQEAADSGDIAHKKAVERQHGVVDTGTATEDEKEGYVDYVLSNPDLRETAEALGLTRQEMAEFGHKQYETHEVGQYKWDYAQGKAYIDRGGGLLDYSVTRDSTKSGRLNRLANTGASIVGNEDLVNSALDMTDADFQSLMRGIESDPAGYGTSRMWQARGLIADAFGGSPWDLANFNATGWNMDPDNPYARGIQAGTIDVASDVGQLLDTGDEDFLQDRYEDEYRKEDFPDDWVDDAGKWQGPADLGQYWNAISTAVRNEEGDLRSLIPSSEWTTYNQGGGPGAGTGTFGATNLGAYTPMAAQDWSGIMPQGVFAGSAVQPTQAMQGLVADQGLQYQPWAMPDNSVAGPPFVSQNVQYNAPLNYSPVGGTTTTSGDTTTDSGDTTTTQLQDWQNPQFNARTGAWMPQGFASNMDWYNSLLTLDEQKQGAQNLFKTGKTGLNLEPKNFVNPLATLDLYNNPGFTTNVDAEETYFDYE